MNFFSFNHTRDRPIPIWSVRNGVSWCSIGGLPLDIPPDVNDYVLKPDHNGFRTKMKQEGAEEYAAYFSPHFHWLGWSPMTELTTPIVESNLEYQDPAWVAFGNHEVGTNEEWVDTPSTGSEMDDPGDEVFVHSLRLDERNRRGFLYNLTRDYHETNFYFLMYFHVPFHYAWTEAEKSTGRFRRCSPEFLDEQQGLTARREFRMSSMPSYQLWREDLERFDAFFQDTRFGRVGERLSEFRHNWAYRVVDGIHFGARILETRHERRVCAERFHAIKKCTRVGKETFITITFIRQNPFRVDEPPERRQLPNPHLFELSDFGDVASPNEWEEPKYFREDSYRVREKVRFRYAPQPDRSFNSFDSSVTDWSTAVVHPTRSEPTSMHPGSHSVLGERGRNRGYERGPRAREPMSPTQRSAKTEDLGFSSRWVRSMASVGGYDAPRCRDSRSASPRNRNVIQRGRGRSWDGYRRASPSPSRSRRFPSTGSASSRSSRSNSSRRSSIHDQAPIDVDPTDVALNLAREDAVEAIRAWALASKITEFMVPGKDGAEWYWKVRWLEATILRCKDERALLRMKVWTACLGFTDIVEVINFAIGYGVPFQLYVKQSEVQNLGLKVEMTELEGMALEAMYSPGFVESPLEHGTGGGPLYARYLAHIRELLRRPHAPGFIYLGGLPSYIAQVYDPQLVDRLRLGPSLQVTTFGRGEYWLDKTGDQREFYVTD
ncbi:hypothetical protein K438DRAFT_1987934 [Mycena galopus ATCC 62051]|nr:hypothetical protein K438DRAFT_1987934 [Mycena galopus ATCC 62051]